MVAADDGLAEHISGAPDLIRRTISIRELRNERTFWTSSNLCFRTRVSCVSLATKVT